MLVEHLQRQRTALHGQRILVVEDDALVAMMMADGLLDAGAEVVGPAACVDEALDLIEQTTCDGGLSAAVLDVYLEGTAIWRVADRLADLGVPFVFATGWGEYCDRGAHTSTPVVAKPFDPDTLVAAIKGSLMARNTYL